MNYTNPYSFPAGATMQRVTEKNLNALARRINEVAGTPVEYATMCAGGERVFNTGHYFIDYAYGGCMFVQLVNGSAERGITRGYEPKRKVFAFMRAYLAGLEADRAPLDK